MKWVKRNLFFLIGTVVALGLIGAGGYYLWIQMGAESQLADDIKKEYGELTTLLTTKPQPGKQGSTNDNVQAAKDQAAALRDWVAKVRPGFRGIPPITGGGGRFPNQLDETIAELHRAADQAGVLVPKGYYFTFQAQRNMLGFAPAGVGRLAMHLSEIKAICEVLFAARINSLTSLQREVASANDTNAPDYLPPGERTTSTPQATLTPYGVSFDCFSGELAAVLEGLASSPHGFVVREIEVEPAAPMGGGPGAYGMTPADPGSGPGGRRGGRGATPQPSSKPVTLVNENRLKVNLLIEVVKLK
jgi:hypothetical protein